MVNFIAASFTCASYITAYAAFVMLVVGAQ